MKIDTISRTVTVEHFEYPLTEPEELTSLTAQYKEYVSTILWKYLQEHVNTPIKLLFKRIKLTHSGGIQKKEIWGTVTELKEDRFAFTSHEGLDGIYYEIPFKNTVRFFNALGWIPFLAPFKKKGMEKKKEAMKMNPFQNCSTEKTMSYFDFLAKAKSLMREAVGTTHSATLYFRYNKENNLFRKGNFKVECEIIKVNESNVEYYHFRTSAYVNPKDFYADYVPNPEGVDRFVAPDRYLRKVSIVFGRKNNINPHDDSDDN